MENTLCVGVIGLHMGRHHLAAVHEYGANIGAICDIDPEKLATYKEEYQLSDTQCYTDWKELLKRDDINAVVIATPDQLHREEVEAFLAAGKHVLCEKPLALTREDICAIVKAAKASNRKCMVGQISRFHTVFVKLKELADSGVIGDIYYMETEYAHDYATILKPWDPSCENNMDKRISMWRSDPARHGVIGGGCHAVDLIRWFCGDPIEVMAYGTHKMLPQVSYDDATIAILKFPNDVIGKVFVSTGCKRPYTRITSVYGTKGTLVCDSTKGEILLYTIGEDGVHVNETPELITVEIKHHNAVDEFKQFARHIENDEIVEMDADLGARTVEVCLSIVKSSEIGKPVSPDYQFC